MLCKGSFFLGKTTEDGIYEFFINHPNNVFINEERINNKRIEELVRELEDELVMEAQKLEQRKELQRH